MSYLQARVTLRYRESVLSLEAALSPGPLGGGVCACVCVCTGTDAGVTACGRAARQAGRLTHRWSGHGPSEREARAEAAQGSVSLTPGEGARAGASGKAVTLPSCRTGVPGAGQRLRVLWGGRQGPRKQRASRAAAPGPCGLREFVRPLSGRFLVPKVGCTSPAWAGGEAYTRWFRQVPADEDPEGSARGSTWRRIFQGVRCPHTPAPAGPPSRPLLRGGLGEVPVCLNQSCEASEGEAG